MTPIRFATNKQLEKIHHTVRHDWSISEKVKDLLWQKDLSKLSVNQAHRLINYLTYHDENSGHIALAQKLVMTLPESPDYRRMKVLEATKNGGVYEDEEVTIQ